jgi:hypothetical protein
MPAAILAYGYVISHLDRDAVEDLLLSAAHVEGRMQEGAPGEAQQRDHGYQLGLIGLQVRDFGDGYQGGVILASHVEAVTPDEPVAATHGASLDVDTERLSWAIGVLGRSEEGAPGWLLALDSA